MTEETYFAKPTIVCSTCGQQLAEQENPPPAGVSFNEPIHGTDGRSYGGKRREPLARLLGRAFAGLLVVLFGMLLAFTISLAWWVFLRMMLEKAGG
jgi:hypothetical protein